MGSEIAVWQLDRICTAICVALHDDCFHFSVLPPSCFVVFCRQRRERERYKTCVSFQQIEICFWCHHPPPATRWTLLLLGYRQKNAVEVGEALSQRSLLLLTKRATRMRGLALEKVRRRMLHLLMLVHTRTHSACTSHSVQSAQAQPRRNRSKQMRNIQFK